MMRASVLVPLLLQLQVSFSASPNVGTCKGNCYQKGGSDSTYDLAPSCFCDPGCTNLQDCCLDFTEHCGVINQLQGSCAGKCGQTLFEPYTTCRCDDGCEEDRTCCSDYGEQCKSLSASDWPPTPLAATAPEGAITLPPVCRDSMECAYGVDQTLPNGPCFEYLAGQYSAGYCAFDNVTSACAATCHEAENDWAGIGHGNCSTYDKSLCATDGSDECNNKYCVADGAFTQCPVACGVCRSDFKIR